MKIPNAQIEAISDATANPAASVLPTFRKTAKRLTITISHAMFCLFPVKRSIVGHSRDIVHQGLFEELASLWRTINDQQPRCADDNDTSAIYDA